MPRDVDIESHEKVVSEIFEQGKDLSREGRMIIANSNLNYLNSDAAAMEYSAPSLAYLRKVWKDVASRWDAYESDIDRENREWDEQNGSDTIRPDA